MSKGAAQTTSAGWTSTQAYVLAVICLVLGAAIGWFARGGSGAGGAQAAVPGSAANVPAANMAAGGQPSPEQMKHMADVQAQPMLEQLKSNPNDPALLAKVGDLYYDVQDYKDATMYYERSLKIDPKNPNVRTDYGTAFYYMGDPDRAIKEFETALKDDPKHAQTMFNMGMVKWQGKADATGAVAAWEQLLKTNPDYPERAKVESYIAQAKQHTNIKPGTKTSKPASM